MINSKNSPIGFLTSNQIKLIAAVLMTVDHVGMLLFPNVIIFRCIGRLSMPLFAYMISEGCRYTKNRTKYLLRLLILGSLFQVVYVIFERDWFFNVFFTFSIAIALCMVCDKTKYLVKKKKFAGAVLLFLGAAFVVWVLLVGLNLLLPDGSKISFDAGFFGIFLPLMIYLAPGWILKAVAMAAVCFLISLDFGGIQYFSLLSVPIALLYNGKRGKAPLKAFFYVYYPAHLAILYGIAYLVSVLGE